MSLQQTVDEREDEVIRAYERWQGWRDEHALQEIERRLSYPAAPRSIWAVVLGAALAVALASIIWR